MVIKMQNADYYQCDAIYHNFFGHKLSPELLKTLPENVFTPAKLIFYLAKHMWNTSLTDEQIVQEFLDLF